MVALDHINLTVRNLQESINWYSRVFGFEVVEEALYKGRKMAVIRSQNNMLCMYEYPDLKAPEDDNQNHRHNHFALRITDVKQWEEIIEKEKVAIDHTWQYPHSYSWYLYDPTGYEIEVVHWHDQKVSFADVS